MNVAMIQPSSHPAANSPKLTTPDAGSFDQHLEKAVAAPPRDADSPPSQSSQRSDAPLASEPKAAAPEDSATAQKEKTPDAAPPKPKPAKGKKDSDAADTNEHEAAVPPEEMKESDQLTHVKRDDETVQALAQNLGPHPAASQVPPERSNASVSLASPVGEEGDDDRLVAAANVASEKGAPAPSAGHAAAAESSAPAKAFTAAAALPPVAAKPASENSPQLTELVPQVGAEPAAHAKPNAQSAASAPPPPPPPSAATELDPNVARVARGLQNAIQQSGGLVTLRLQPPELGLVRIQMEIQQGVASVQFQTEHSSVRDLLSHQLASLRDTLQNQGLVVEKMDVQTIPASVEGSQGRGADGSSHQGRSAGQFFTQRQGSESRQQERQPPGSRQESFEQTLVNTVG